MAVNYPTSPGSAGNVGGIISGPGTASYYGDPYAAADGSTLLGQGQTTIDQFNAAYGASARAQWVTDRNMALLQTGQAIQTPYGIELLSNVIAQLQQHGYTGPLDANTVATAYAMLQSASPGPASGTTAAGSTAAAATHPAVSGLGGVLSSIPQPLLIGGGALLVFMMLFRRHGQ